MHEKQLLGFAFSRTPAETVSVCVWGVHSPATLATRYSTSVGPEQKATAEAEELRDRSGPSGLA